MDISEDSGLQIMRRWGPTIGHFENSNLEILDLPCPTKGSKTRDHGGGMHMYISIYIYICARVARLFLEGGLVPRKCPHSTWDSSLAAFSLGLWGKGGRVTGFDLFP